MENGGCCGRNWSAGDLRNTCFDHPKTGRPFAYRLIPCDILLTWGIKHYEESDGTTAVDSVCCDYSGHFGFDPSVPLRDLGNLLRTERRTRCALAQTAPRRFVGELCDRLATRVSLHKHRCTRTLQDCRSVGRTAELPLFRRDFLVDYFRACACGRAGHQLPSDCGSPLRCRRSDRSLRRLQRKLDADHANHSAARELAGGVAR